MNFKAEIALFQASFYCTKSDHESPTNATDLEAPGHRKQTIIKVNAVCQAVREITHGLEGDRSDVEKRLWNFKLHSILFCKILENKRASISGGSERCSSASSLRASGADCPLKYFAGVLNGLPDHIELCVYLEIVHNLQWEPLCAKVLGSLNYKVSKDLLSDMTAECIQEDRLDLLISILSGLLAPSSFDYSDCFTKSKPGVCGTNVKQTMSVNCYRLVASACEQMLADKAKIEDRCQRCGLILAILTSLDALVSVLHFAAEDQESTSKLDASKKGLFGSKTTPCDDDRQDGWSFSNDIYNLELLSSVRDENFSRIVDEDKTMMRGSQGGRSKGESSPESKEHLLEAVTSLLSILHTLLLRDWTDFSFSPLDLDTLDPDSRANGTKNRAAARDLNLVNKFSRVLDRLHRYMGQGLVMSPAGCPPMIDTKLVQRQCSDLTDYFAGMLDCTEALEMKASSADDLSGPVETTSGEEGHTRLPEAITRVDSRLEGYEDDLAHLLSSLDEWDDDALIECLERNTSALALPRFVKQLIDVAMAMDAGETLNKTLLQRVLKVLLASFSALPLLLQNQLRDYLWSYPAGVSVFVRHNASNFDLKSTTAFNRLVTLAEGQENTEVLTSLSCLALQSPVQTLQQAVSRAVSNAAICQAVCQVLQTMPSLATLRLQPSQWPLLCQLIQEATGIPATLASEEANLVQLVSTLLQPYKPFLDPRCPFKAPAVLSAQGITQACILPHLNTNVLEKASSLSHLAIALKLLDEVLDCPEVQLQDGCSSSVLGLSPFPVMLCLCGLLDGLRVLWDGNAAAGQRAELKGAVLCTLRKMARMVTIKLDDETERGLSWLGHRVWATLHWSTAVTLNELLPEYQPHQQKLVPESVFNMCGLPATVWSPIAMCGSHQRPASLCNQLTELLLCCRVSERLTAILSQTLQMPAGCSSCSFREALTLALVQVLPHCIMGEWQCIVGMLTRLVASGILVVSCSAGYLLELPLMDISDFLVYLSLSQLLLSVMQLLTGPCCRDWATPQLLHHVTRCYVATLQTLTSDMLNSDLCNAPGCLFVIGQLFCHACEVIGSLPTEDLKEQVFVLTLDFLSRMQDLNTEWTNHKAVLELATNQKLAGQQRKTLLQKIGGLKLGTGHQ